MNGILNAFKPKGMSSYDVIRVIKQISGERKIGHTGTLDPMAQGVLPVFIGKMTKLIPWFNHDDKTYRVAARLGARSTTLDREGELEVVPVPSDCDAERIDRHLRMFVGEIQQLPPMYSAVKLNGKRLYQYAREGKAVYRRPRTVTVHEITDFQADLPDFSFCVRCSKGTYIRTLVDDLGRELGTAAYLIELTRIRSGEGFSVENAVALDRIKNLNKMDLQKIFIDPQYLLRNWHQVVVQSAPEIRRISQGRPIEVPDEAIRFSRKGKTFENSMVKDGHNRLIATGRLEFSQDGRFRFSPSKVFI